MSDVELLDTLKRHLTVALNGGGAGGAGGGADGAGKLDPQVEQTIEAALRAAIRAYRMSPSNSSSYDAALGAYIIGQNPYARFEQLEFPNLPLAPNGENQWVRKNGVLAQYTALKPMPRDDAIPAGYPIDFPYADWKYLREPEGQEVFNKPPGDQQRNGETPPDLTRTYVLNIVKSIRLRYTIYDRRYDDDKRPKDKKDERDRQTGYILVSYSGSNNS